MVDRTIETGKVLDTGVTTAYIERTLLDFYGEKNVRVEKWDFELLEGGFSSKVIRVCLRWSAEIDQSNLPDKVVVKAINAGFVDDIFVKVGGQNSDERSMTGRAMVQLLSRTECETYKILSKADGTVPIPRIYGCEPGIILMEDMCTRAGICENLAAGFTFGQWRSVALYLANFHAWSLKTDLEWRSKLPAFDRESVALNFYVDLVRNGLKPVVEKYVEYFGHIDQSIYDKEITLENLVRNFNIYRELVPEVMSHNDVWMNNIFLDKDPHNPDQLGDQVAAFVDWQVASPGCGLNDVVRVAIWSINHALRPNHEHEILRLYVEEFNRKSGLLISMENVQRVYDHLKAVYSLIGVPMTDLMLCNVKKLMQKNSDDGPKTEILTRMRVNYDFAAAYFKRRHDEGVSEL